MTGVWCTGLRSPKFLSLLLLQCLSGVPLPLSSGFCCWVVGFRSCIWESDKHARACRKVSIEGSLDFSGLRGVPLNGPAKYRKHGPDTNSFGMRSIILGNVEVQEYLQVAHSRDKVAHNTKALSPKVARYVFFAYTWTSMPKTMAQYPTIGA